MQTRARWWGLLRSPLLWSILLSTFVAVFGLQRFGTTDFEAGNLPALNALRSGHVGTYLDLSSVDMGSYVLRLPLVLLPNLWGGGSLALYRVLALPALIGLAWFATDLWWRGRRAGATAVAASAGLVLSVLNPFVFTTLIRTHPEDVVGGLLCVAALFSAHRGRANVTGILLGLAIANKAWALVAVVPVLWVMGPFRLRPLLIAGSVPALVLSPLVVRVLTTGGGSGSGGAGGSGLSQVTSIASTSYVLKPWDIWWFFGDSHHPTPSLFGYVQPFGYLRPLYRTPATWVTHISHPLAILVPLTLCLWLVSRLDRRRWTDGLLLLALALQLRCMLDAWNIDYYEVPFTIALLAWELLDRKRLPVISIVVIFSGWFVMTILPFYISPDAQALTYLLWSLSTVSLMLLLALRPRPWRGEQDSEVLLGGQERARGRDDLPRGPIGPSEAFGIRA